VPTLPCNLVGLGVTICSLDRTPENHSPAAQSKLEERRRTLWPSDGGWRRHDFAHSLMFCSGVS
jgi:hypothetical protein